MNWILGFVGALVGAVLSNAHGLFGAIAGFFVMFLFGSIAQLKARAQRSDTDIADLQMRLAALQDATVRAARAQHAQSTARTAEPAAAPPPIVSAADIPVPAAPVAEDLAAREPLREDTVSAVPPESPPLPPLRETPRAWEREAVGEPAGVETDASGFDDTPRPPTWADRVVASVRRWFTEGNVPVKVGVLVLFVGVAAALRYAVSEGYLHVPIEVRLAGIAAAAIAALWFGWRERLARPAFGLSLQGGAIGVLLMTVFAAFKLYHLLPPMAAFALIVLLVAGAALLAVLQDAIALAALGFLGGYLAPVLISTGSANHVALFSYYAVLNAAVFGVSWKRSWRLLNLIGFAFTFGVGTLWGSKYYRPELFATVEPFLVLFFAFYVAIGLLYVLRQSEHRRPWVDGTLVFGTPLLAFPLQAALLKDDTSHMALAFSALVVAVLYGGLVWWLRKRRGERLLTEAYGALALGFATLAVPLAFSAATTASVWALEGAAAAWLGIRQNRMFPWLAGLALQLLAAGAYILSQISFVPVAAQSHLLLLNPGWLGAAILALSGAILSLVHDRLRPIRFLPAALFAWAVLWWLFGEVTQLDLAGAKGIGAWRFALLYAAATIALAGWLRARLAWHRMGQLVAVSAAIVLCSVPAFDRSLGGPLAPATLGAWAADALALLFALRILAVTPSRALAVAHLAWLWTVAAAATLQAAHVVGEQHLANGWNFAAVVAPVVAMTLLLWRRQRLLAWPAADAFPVYASGWFAPASVLLALAFVGGLFVEGSASPLPYVPLLNPLELALLAIGALLSGLAEGTIRGVRRIWPYAGFALLTSATLRAVHHWHGEAWGPGMFDSGVTQTALTVVWSLLGVGAWIAGSKRGDRRLWMGGLVLMIVVLAKLAFVDRHYMGGVSGIASFLVVGLLMVVVGYMAPSPPKQPQPESPITPEAESA